MSDYMEKAKKGFALLSKEQRETVDIGQLWMASSLSCILGQIFGTYGQGVEALFGDKWQTDLAAEHGFYTNIFYDYDLLEAAWIELLRNERELDELLSPVGTL